MSFLFKNLRLLDPRWKESRPGYEVLVEGDTIKEVSPSPSPWAKVVDCASACDAGPIDTTAYPPQRGYINRMGGAAHADDGALCRPQAPIAASPRCATRAGPTAPSAVDLA
jgi:hypothetical protein